MTEAIRYSKKYCYHYKLLKYSICYKNVPRYVNGYWKHGSTFSNTQCGCPQLIICLN